MKVTYETYSFIVNKQKILDAAFLPVSRWLPDEDDRHLALQVEKGEFLKEFQVEIKWWKQIHENKRASIIDEYIDLWHFVAGMILTETKKEDFDGIYFEIRSIVNREKEFLKYIPKERKLKTLLIRLSNANNRYNMLGIATLIIEMLGFTDQDVKAAYIAKNKVNFERIAAGY